MLALLALFAPAPAHADQTLTGDYLQVDYGPAGLWNSSTAAAGLGFRVDTAADYCEFVYPGSPWAHLSGEWTQGGASEGYSSNSEGDTGIAFTLVSEEDLSAGTTLTARHVFTGGDLQLTKVEQFDAAGAAISLQIRATNTGTTAMSDLVLYYEADMDQDETGCTPGSVASEEGYSTLNDVLDVDGDGSQDWVQSIGPDSGWTAGFLACDPADAELGHFAQWNGSYLPSGVTLVDEEGAEDDDAQGVRMTIGDLPAGASAVVGLVVALGGTDGDAHAEALAALASCDLCDADADGVDAELCGGDDCDDADADVYPGAGEQIADGVDSDCDGLELCYADADGDGYGDPAVEVRGALDCSGPGESNNFFDCDDSEATTYEGAPDTWYDGVDSDCAGDDDFDADGDGAAGGEGGDDCDDADPAVNPGASEVWYDGVDQDCDGNDDDQDGDGFAEVEDCDDTDAGLAEDCGGDGSDDTAGGDDGDEDDDDKGTCSTVGAGDSLLIAFMALLPLLGRRRD